MATNQKTRPASGNQTGRAPAKKRKKQNPLQKLLGGNKKAAPQKKTTAQPRRRPDEAARELNATALPEEVFNTQQNSRVRTPEEQKRAATRKRSAARAKERAEEAKKAANRPNVTYTQPMPFNLNKLLLQLTVVIAVVLAVVIGLSVFFKVDRVVVYGNDAYSAWTIQEASGIEGGENLLSFGRTRACGKIITALPYVKTVRIGIKLPDTVNIYVEEFDVSYAIEDTNGGWWLMTSSGKIAEQIDKAKSNSYTKVEGVTLVGPVVGEQAVAYEIFTPEETENETVSTEETTPVVTVTSNDRLQAALLILESLEANDIVGEISVVNVESIYNLEMMYGQRYQVKLGTTSDMDYKISMMKASVAQLNEYQAGILDVSFTTYTEGPFYTPLA